MLGWQSGRGQKHALVVQCGSRGGRLMVLLMGVLLLGKMLLLLQVLLRLLLQMLLCLLRLLSLLLRLCHLLLLHCCRHCRRLHLLHQVLACAGSCRLSSLIIFCMGREAACILLANPCGICGLPL